MTRPDAEDAQDCVEIALSTSKPAKLSIWQGGFERVEQAR